MLRHTRMHTMRLAIAAAAVMAMVPGATWAGSTFPNLNNQDMTCPTSGVNDYEVVYTSKSPFTIGQIWVGPPDSSSLGNKNSFPPGTASKGEFVNVSPTGVVTYDGKTITNIVVSGNGTDKVEVTYSGTTFSAGQSAHVGIFGTGGSNATIANAYWTINGKPVNSLDGHQAGVKFTGTSSEYLLVRVTDYNSSHQVIGHNWTEAQATGFTLVGNPGVNLNVSYATMLSPTEIPLNQLNESLTGFGSESSIMTLSSTPEPSSMVLAALGMLGVAAYARSRRGPRTRRAISRA
jgi:PEP-CTERM motif